MKNATKEELFDDFKMLAHYWNSLMEGDTHLIDDAYTLLRKYKLVDENGFLIEDEED